MGFNLEDLWINSQEENWYSVRTQETIEAIKAVVLSFEQVKSETCAGSQCFRSKRKKNFESLF